MTEQDDEPVVASQRALDPHSESEMTFQGRKIRTASMQNGQGFVALHSLCDAFGIDYSSQRKRLYRTAVFRDHAPLVYLSTAGGRQAQVCLSAFTVPAFLMGVETARVASDEAREMLEAFQEEGMIVLAEHFGLSERGEMRFLGESVVRMTLEQDAFEEMVVRNIEKELTADRQSREEKIQQIGALREMVMVLGELLIRAGESKRPWPAIYSDMTLQFGFSKVEDITQEAYPKVE